MFLQVGPSSAGESGKDLARRMLAPDPENRLTPEQALESAFLRREVELTSNSQSEYSEAPVAAISSSTR